ncbi:hypothetical protein NECAME_14520 [Necator americanus]|uniref:Uncharacterized protein n=1 Tax=Necator americanus TaxID=51031 RepID=W2SMU8_NECAM|nr:hypothetical protein NECAME_14520 [Necator americanus]ETN70828.1 hypothetical protein NECAME_14520 [Necator americanus]
MTEDGLDILCENDLTAACADRYILGSSPRASNESIDYWVKAGVDFPFENSSHIELTTTVQRTHEVVDVQIIPATAGVKKRLTISGLEPNEIYDIRRCIDIQLPSWLIKDKRFSFNSVSNRLCSEEGCHFAGETLDKHSVDEYAALAAAVVNQIDKFVLVPLGVFFLGERPYLFLFAVKTWDK